MRTSPVTPWFNTDTETVTENWIWTTEETELWANDSWIMENATSGNRSTHCTLTNKNIWLPIISGLFILTSIPGVVGNVMLMFLLPKAPLIHKNVRYQMINMTAAALFLCVWLGGRGIYNVLLAFNVLTLSEPTSPVKCALIEMLATTAAFLLVLSIFGMGAERLYATWKRQTSDRTSEWLSKMIIGLWIAAAFNTFVQLVTSSRAQSLCYCHSIVSFDRRLLLFISVVYFCVEIPAFTIYFVVRRWNKQRLISFGVNKAATHSLAERFQIWNTLRATEVLLYNVIVHGLCWTVVQVSSYPAYLYYHRHSHDYEVDVSSLNVLHIVMFFVIIHASIHPYISIWGSDHLRKTFRRHVEAVTGKKVSVSTATEAAAGEVGQKTMVLNPRPEVITDRLFEPVQAASTPLDDRPQFGGPRVADKAGKRMGIPARQRIAQREGAPAYQVYQITPEQNAALLQRFWR